VIAGLSWVDWTLAAVLALSILAGLVRGFVFEVMALVGWVVAWFVAQWFAPEAAPHLPLGTPGGALNLVVAFIACFVAAIVVWSLLARLVRLLLHATPLSIPDRLLGAGFGLLRGGVLLLAVATVVALTPAATSSAWRTSHGALWLNSALLGLKPVLPEAVARRLPG
jgi:membrane protein required for colicin V production